ncbi:MAG TPA: hypothetical protein VIY48_13045 [Candidatus Paceibacterota bacterium]
MLPPITVDPRNDPRKGRGYRPANSQDSAATTGLVVNPNGTYVSNQNNGVYGAQGQFGSPLPSVNVGVGNRPNSPLFNAIQSNPSAFGIDLNSNAPSTSGYDTRSPAQVYDQQHPLPTPGSPESLALAKSHQQQQEQNTIDSVTSRLEGGDLSALNDLPDADKQAMGLPTTTSGTKDNAEPTDFQKTKAYQYNLENNIPFLSQKRYDYEHHKMITVGQWLKQERNKYNKHGRRKSGGGGGGQAQAAPEEKKNPDYTLQQYGVVNFNTATG